MFMRIKGNSSFHHALKEYYNYSLISTSKKVLDIFENHRDCKVVDPYNARKSYGVLESLDPIRNIPWLASCFCKKKKPNKNFS